MSVNSIGGMSSQAAPYHPQPGVHGAVKPEDGSKKELTTVTTHCSKEHKHDPSCPHTVSTEPAPRLGEPGSVLDKRV